MVAGLFSKSSINHKIVQVFQQFFGIDHEKTLSSDLEGCQNIDEAKSYIGMCLAELGPNTIIVGHSAGGQLAENFIGNPNVALVVSICGPSHNPLRYPLWLWTKTARYLGKILTNQFFRLPDSLTIKLFGISIPEDMAGDSWGNLVGGMNLGCVGGNSTPKKPRTGAECVFVATTGDVLITPGSVQKTAEKFCGHFICLAHSNHIPQIGVGATRRMFEICHKIRDVVPEMGCRVGMMD